jgi:methionine-S-sulfoxide reductase
MGSKKINSIVLGGGCFWCLHSAYSLVKGVNKVTQGYAGGNQVVPGYEDVYSGKTGHAEVVKVEFETKVITLDDILNIFWTIHDPTTLNRQGSDIGEAYRSIILYKNESQKKIVNASIQKAQLPWNGKIVTEVKQLEEFYPAESYHYNYKQDRPDYCNLVINPKLAKLRQKFADKLKNG